MTRAVTPAAAHRTRSPLARAADWLPVALPPLAVVVLVAAPVHLLVRVAAVAIVSVLAAGQLLSARRSGRRLAERVGALTDTVATQSGRDLLTGLPNRTALIDILNARLRPIETDDATDPTDPTDPTLGLLLIALDGVDTIRAMLGYDQGDALVLSVAERVVAAVGTRTPVARLDGGELAVVYGPKHAGDPADVEPLDALAARLLEVIATPLLLIGGEVVTTASIGVASGPATADRPIGAMELLRAARVALGLAHDAGGARVETYRRDADEHAVSDLRLAAELRRAVPDHELEVYYQPIVSLPDRRLAGAEALIRWNHSREGVLTPDRWLDVADAAGLLPEIGRATLDEVCRRFATVGTAVPGRALRIAVNLAPSELRHPDLTTAVAAIMSRSGLDPTQLVVEVSDRAVLDDQAAATILELRRLGVRIALDDFGTGLAAIGRLGHLPIDELKLDDSVVAQAAGGGAEADVLASIVGLCNRLGIEVVAEGVSTERDADALAALGCQYAQGWMFGRPLPFSRFVALLKRMDADDSANDSAGNGPAASGATGEPGGPLDRLV